MDEIVLRSMAKWPDVPDVYGWLALDRRGNWLLKEERIENRALRDFISRNYQSDARGCWFFQNGPQRVFVSLAYAPLVLHFEGEGLLDHCGRPVEPTQKFRDEEGSVLMTVQNGLGLLDDRDLGRVEEEAENFQVILRVQIPRRFGFVLHPVHASGRAG